MSFLRSRRGAQGEHISVGERTSQDLILESYSTKSKLFIGFGECYLFREGGGAKGGKDNNEGVETWNV